MEFKEEPGYTHTEPKETMADRLKKPYVILAGAALAYQILEYFGVGLDKGFYEEAVDFLSIALLGFTVYKTPKNSIV